MILRQPLYPLRHLGESLLLTLPERHCQRISGNGAFGEEAIDHQLLVQQTDGGQLLVGASHFPQSGLLGARHQHQTGAGSISQRGDRLAILAALFLQPRQRAKAGGIPLALLQKFAPGSRQLQQPDGVAGWGRIKDDMVILGQQRLVGQQRGELVKGGDLGGAGAGELLLDAAHHALGQLAAHRPDDPFPIGFGRRGGIYLQRRQTGHSGDGGDAIADLGGKHLPHVGGGVGAHQQHPLAGITEGHRTGAGQRGLAHPALAGEEEKRRWIGQKMVHSLSRMVRRDLAATAARAAAALDDPLDGRLRRRQPGITGQLAAARITAGQHHLPFHQHQWQPLLPGVGQKSADGRCLGKLHRLLGQIETLDGHPLRLGPGEVGCEGDQCLINLGATNTAGAAEGGIKNLNGRHSITPWCSRAAQAEHGGSRLTRHASRRTPRDDRHSTPR